MSSHSMRAVSKRVREDKETHGLRRIRSTGGFPTALIAVAALNGSGLFLLILGAYVVLRVLDVVLEVGRVLVLSYGMRQITQDGWSLKPSAARLLDTVLGPEARRAGRS